MNAWAIFFRYFLLAFKKCCIQKNETDVRTDEWTQNIMLPATADISVLYNQVRLFSQPTHSHSLESLLLLNYCCQPPSWFNVKVCSCFPSLHISLFFWPYPFPHSLFPQHTVALCWRSYFSVEYFTVVLIQTWTNQGFLIFL